MLFCVSTLLRFSNLSCNSSQVRVSIPSPQYIQTNKKHVHHPPLRKHLKQDCVHPSTLDGIVDLGDSSTDSLLLLAEKDVTPPRFDSDRLPDERVHPDRLAEVLLRVEGGRTVGREELVADRSGEVHGGLDACFLPGSEGLDGVPVKGRRGSESVEDEGRRVVVGVLPSVLEIHRAGLLETSPEGRVELGRQGLELSGGEEVREVLSEGGEEGRGEGGAEGEFDGAEVESLEDAVEVRREELRDRLVSTVIQGSNCSTHHSQDVESLDRLASRDQGERAANNTSVSILSRTTSGLT